MLLSRARHVIGAKLRRIGSKYDSGNYTFSGILMKSNVGQDLPRSDHTILAPHDAETDDGKIISRENDYYVPLQVDSPSLVGNNAYKKFFLLKANASGDLYYYNQPSVASVDVWDVSTASMEWQIKKTSVFVNFEKISMRVQMAEIGQVESGDFLVTMPWSVNASFTPIAECRFTDRLGRKWKVEDVDDKTYLNQSYLLRVSQDDR